MKINVTAYWTHWIFLEPFTDLLTVYKEESKTYPNIHSGPSYSHPPLCRAQQSEQSQATETNNSVARKRETRHFQGANDEAEVTSRLVALVSGLATIDGGKWKQLIRDWFQPRLDKQRGSGPGPQGPLACPKFTPCQVESSTTGHQLY